MKEIVKTNAILVAALFALAVALSFSPGLSGAEKKEKAPDFVLKRLDGGTLRLADFRGKPMVLRFMAFW